MPTVKELREKRAPIGAAITKMSADGTAVDTAGQFTPAWVQANNEYNALTAQIEVAERAAQVAKDQGVIADWRADIGREDRRGDTGGSTRVSKRKHQQEAHAELLKEAGFDSDEEVRATAMAAWFSAQLGAYLDEDMQAACKLIRFNPMAKELTMPLFGTEDYSKLVSACRSVHPSHAANKMNGYKATLSIGSGTAGGYLVPPETLIRSLEVNMLMFGGMRQAAETIRTATGERMSWPTADDTGNTGVQLGESASIGSSVDPSFAKVYWDAYKFSSKPCLIPTELLQDAAFDVAKMIGEMFGIRLGRVGNTKFTLGSGAATPMGLISKLVALGNDTLSYPTGYAKGYILSGKAGSFVFDDIVKLKASVEPSYRVNPAFMCHDQILMYMRLFKDGIGRPLWQSNIRDGAPDTLDGDPIVTNQDMDNTVATGKNVLAYGDLSKYKIRTVGATRMYRLEERYRDTDQDGFIAFTREDGNLLTAGNTPVKLLQVA